MRRTMAIALLATVAAACSGDDEALPEPTLLSTSTSTVPVESFCDGAVAVLDRPSFPADGGDLVAELRALDTTELDDSELRFFVLAVDNLDAALTAHKEGSLGGWSTREVAGSVNAPCDTELGYWTIAS